MKLVRKMFTCILALAMILQCGTPFASAKNFSYSSLTTTLQQTGFDISESQILDISDETINMSSLNPNKAYAYITEGSGANARVIVVEPLADNNVSVSLIENKTVVVTDYVDRNNGQVIRTDHRTAETVYTTFPQSLSTLNNVSHPSRGAKTYLGRIRYQYAAGSNTNLCGAWVYLTEITAENDLYDTNKQFRDDVAFFSYLMGAISIIPAVAIPFVGAAAWGKFVSKAAIVSTGAGSIAYLIPVVELSAHRTTNAWEVVDTSNTSNTETFSGHRYVILAEGSYGDTYDEGDFFPKTDFTSMKSGFANYVYPQLFSYTIFNIYDWYIA